MENLYSHVKSYYIGLNLQNLCFEKRFLFSILRTQVLVLFIEFGPASSHDINKILLLAKIHLQVAQEGKRKNKEILAHRNYL